jgi:N-sulfoglucosamine sulfohydrolase
MLNLWDTYSVKNKDALPKRNYWSHQIKGLPTVPVDAQSIDTPPYLFGHIGKGHPNLLEDIAAYYDAIRRVDHSIEKVLQELDARALSKETVIAFTSDHGPTFPRGKQMVYELGVHVPLIMVAPGAKPATRNASLVRLIDLMPTLIEFAGGEVPTLPEARSLAPILRGAGNSRQYVAAEFFQHWGTGDFFPSYTIRDTRYKLIYNSRPKLSRPWGERLRIPWVDALPHITDEVFATAWERALNPPEFELYDLDIAP